MQRTIYTWLAGRHKRHQKLAMNMLACAGPNIYGELAAALIGGRPETQMRLLQVIEMIGAPPTRLLAAVFAMLSKVGDPAVAAKIAVLPAKLQKSTARRQASLATLPVMRPPWNSQAVRPKPVLACGDNSNKSAPIGKAGALRSGALGALGGCGN